MKPPRPYVRIDRGLRREARWRKLSHAARYILLCLLTAPETTSVPGLLAVDREALAVAVGLTCEQFDGAWAELVSLGYARNDWEASLIWLTDGMLHNAPANPNVVKGWRSTWPTLPECPLLGEAAEHLRSEVSQLGETPAAQQAFTAAINELLGPVERVSGTVPETIPGTVPGTNPEGYGKPVSVSGAGSGSSTETKTGGGEGECERAASAAASASGLAHPPLSSEVGESEKKSEKPAKVRRVGKPTRMPEGFVPSAECMTGLLVDFRQADLDAQLVGFRENFGLQGKVSTDWDGQFVAWVAGSVARGNLHKKPPPRQPRQAAAPPKPWTTRTPAEQEVFIAEVEKEIGPLTPPTPEPAPPPMPPDIADLLHHADEPEASEWPDVGEVGFAAALAKTRGAKPDNDESETA